MKELVKGGKISSRVLGTVARELKGRHDIKLILMLVGE
jgi:hypothetical protein